MALEDRLKAKAEKPKQRDSSELITGLLIPVKIPYGRRTAKGYLAISAEAVLSGQLEDCIELALDDAGLEINIYEQQSGSSYGSGYGNNKGYSNKGYSNNRRD